MSCVTVLSVWGFAHAICTASTNARVPCMGTYTACPSMGTYTACPTIIWIACVGTHASG
ncbi:hypothetical protein COLSTE_01943 [Collinsella stercoris DSM 13279]|uniref:Uncharacterized protein n=1 Tax=Collinsella stercoris DSM 13279 TaxID=445975 RepID=B6GCW6_9ACTN|nr:hypothetical protein COLSTE_01943 [Collinsella stercoris DSM 13279]